jgi:hypothetical protein
VALDVVAVRLERALAAFAGRDPRLKALEPPGDDRVEAKVRRERRFTTLGGCYQRLARVARGRQIETDRPEAKPARVPEADRILAVRL